jgi:hypothetical protein
MGAADDSKISGRRPRVLRSGQGDPDRWRSEQGGKTEPFESTGCTVLNPEQYNKKVEEKLERVKAHPRLTLGLKGEDEVRKKMRTLGFVNITEVMGHVTA